MNKIPASLRSDFSDCRFARNACRFASESVPISSEYTQMADDLYREGRTLKWIAQYFNEQGFKSKSGNPWSRSMVFNLYHATGHKIDLLETIHRTVIAEAISRGLNYSEIAREFNERDIRRTGGRPWTPRIIASVCYRFNSLQRRRTQKRSASAELSEPVVMPSSI